MAIPAFAITDWATANPIPGTGSGRFTSTVLARRLIAGLVVTRSALDALRRVSRKQHRAVAVYLRAGKVEPGQEQALASAKRWVYDWLAGVNNTPELSGCNAG